MFGQLVIDGLWATPAVSVQSCGYFAPGNMAPGDHSLLWMDVFYDSVLGRIPPLPLTLMAQRLRLYDIKTTKKYLDHYHQLLHQYHVLHCQVALHNSVHCGAPLNLAQAAKANAIDAFCTKVMLTAE